MLDPRKLRVLKEVAERGSLSAAAQALSYTPSAISQQIAALEREAGLRLLERGPRGVRLTEPGRALVRHAADVLSRLAAAQDELAALAGLQTGELRLGWFATAGPILMPRAIAAFRRRHPGISLVLVEADADECIELLRASELDLALVYEFELQDFAAGEDLEQVPLLDDHLSIALPPGHPLAEREWLSMRDLADEAWIQGVRHGSTVDVLHRAARLAGFEPNVAFQTEDHMAVQGLVAAGVGVAFMPRLTLPTARPDVVIRPLERPRVVRRVRAALAAGRYRPPAMLAMVEILREVCADFEGDAEAPLMPAADRPEARARSRAPARRSSRRS
jgi:DNA-binding transcriptional LysR family regulator